MRSPKQKASAEAYKESLKRAGPLSQKPDPPKESWWLKPDFYREAKAQAPRMNGEVRLPIHEGQHPRTT